MERGAVPSATTWIVSLALVRMRGVGWRTVTRMNGLPDSGISCEDSQIIVSNLASQMASSGTVAAASVEVPEPWWTNVVR
jgi:translation initiation factor 1 (eIF-1/SUI1)